MEKSEMNTRMPALAYLASISRTSRSVEDVGSINGVEICSRLITEETWRSTISQMPWLKASSTQLPAEGPLKALMA
jgi:hypothetical protein